MANKIRIRRGLKDDLPELSVGEFAFCTDSSEVFIGSENGNINLASALRIVFSNGETLQQMLDNGEFGVSNHLYGKIIPEPHRGHNDLLLGWHTNDDISEPRWYRYIDGILSKI